MMNRAQKKCFIAASGTHALLVVILFVGPAFLSSNDKGEDFQVLDIIPANIIDANFYGGGNPQATPPPPAPQAQLQPQKAPEPVAVKQTQPEPKAPEPEATPRKIQISTRIVTRKPDGKSTAKPSTTTAQASSASKQQQAFNSSVRSLRENLSSSTTVDMPGPGGGGPVYAGYKQVIGSIYYQAWIVPDDTDADTATAVVSVVIARDGSIVSARIIRSSGNAPVDRSVQAALDRVTSVPPFPAGAKEDRRSFTINFNLKARQALG